MTNGSLHQASNFMQPHDLPPVTAASIRAAIEATNAERRQIAQQTGVVIPPIPPQGLVDELDRQRRDGVGVFDPRFVAEDVAKERR